MHCLLKPARLRRKGRGSLFKEKIVEKANRALKSIKKELLSVRWSVNDLIMKVDVDLSSGSCMSSGVGRSGLNQSVGRNGRSNEERRFTWVKKEASVILFE